MFDDLMFKNLSSSCLLLWILNKLTLLVSFWPCSLLGMNVNLAFFWGLIHNSWASSNSSSEISWSDKFSSELFLIKAYIFILICTLEFFLQLAILVFMNLSFHWVKWRLIINVWTIRIFFNYFIWFIPVEITIIDISFVI